MTYAYDTETLRLLFQRSTALPHLKHCAMRLLNEIDEDGTDLKRFEKTVAADPALTAMVIRSATRLAETRASGNITTIRAAIMHLGSGSIRSIAASLALQSMTAGLGNGMMFNTERFARHSLFVGTYSAFLYRKWLENHEKEVEWTPEELFAAGVLHDIGEALMFRVAPDIHTRVAVYAHKREICFANAYLEIYNSALSELTLATVASWGFPDIFRVVIEKMDAPWLAPEAYAPLACLTYANQAAEECGFESGAAPRKRLELTDIKHEVGLSEEEEKTTIEVVARHVYEIMEPRRAA
ncbi:MAG: HDOD domain-containing protein [Armatimonadetes bacterium]|nr:HDOD domain-containing protein [Armatimonadota bacterium]